MSLGGVLAFAMLIGTAVQYDREKIGDRRDLFMLRAATTGWML